ncbi:MAG: restriction endonuclease subunit S [Bacteroidales bacterium]|nr:restriction endonuclease subunit S [Bacteroidales bacterium]
MKQIDTSQWKDIPISSLFNIVKGTRLTKFDMKDGDIPFIGASANNNGVTAYISNYAVLHPANTITVTYNGSVGEAFYQEKPFAASDDVNVLYPHFPLTKNIAMFLIPVLKATGKQYEFIDKWRIDLMRRDTIKLPVTPAGTPDWEFMEDFIQSMADRAKQHLQNLSHLI